MSMSIIFRGILTVSLRENPRSEQQLILGLRNSSRSCHARSCYAFFPATFKRVDTSLTVEKAISAFSGCSRQMFAQLAAKAQEMFSKVLKFPLKMLRINKYISSLDSFLIVSYDRKAPEEPLNAQ